MPKPAAGKRRRTRAACAAMTAGSRGYGLMASARDLGGKKPRRQA